MASDRPRARIGWRREDPHVSGAPQNGYKFLFSARTRSAGMSSSANAAWRGARPTLRSRSRMARVPRIFGTHFALSSAAADQGEIANPRMELPQPEAVL